MKLYHIAAMDENRVIGKDGDIPWHLSEDLKRFKVLTKGHSIIMGRKTFQSIHPYAPLVGRKNVVLTSKEKLYYDGRAIDGFVDDGKGTSLLVANSIPQALEICSKDHEVYVIGGQTVYESTLHLADELRLTHVHQDVSEGGGDTFYPELGDEEWVSAFREEHDGYTFVDYVRTECS